MKPILFWPSAPLDQRDRLPAQPGLYAVRFLFLTFYVGKAAGRNGIEQRWEGKGHHRYAQAARLPWCRLAYYILPKDRVDIEEKRLIKIVERYPWNWNGDKVPDRWSLFANDAAWVLLWAGVLVFGGMKVIERF